MHPIVALLRLYTSTSAVTLGQGPWAGRVLQEGDVEQGALGDSRGLSPRSVEGGELFERIIDDDYHLTEVDCMVFVRQICEGIRFMHHMRVLHLDLKVRDRGVAAGAGYCSWGWGRLGQ